MTDKWPDTLEMSRQIIFEGLDNDVPLELQRAMITIHRAAVLAQIEPLMNKSMNELASLLGAELLHKAPGYRMQEEVAAGSLRKLLTGQNSVTFFDDGHVGTIYKAAGAGVTELPEGITPQQTSRAAVLLASAIAPHLTEEFMKDDRVSNLFLSTKLALSLNYRETEVSDAVLVAQGLRTARQLQAIAENAPESISAARPYLSGVASLCNAAAAKVLNEFKNGMEARKPRPGGTDLTL
jgi:hypothetical protein